MRPVRVNLTEITEKHFIELMLNYYPSIEDKKWIRKFFREMKSRYFQIILDLDSGEVLQAFIEDGTWILSRYYLDIVPTIDKLDENGYLLEEYIDDELSENIKLENKSTTNKSENIEDKINSILEKISKLGIETLTKEERKVLDKYKED